MIKGAINAALKVIDKKNLFVSAIIVAAGNSSRMRGIDKLYAPLGDETVLSVTIKAFQNNPHIREIILVLNGDRIEPGRRLCQTNNYSKVSHIVAGGNSRAESSMLGVAAADKKSDIILIHDGDRPFVTQEMILHVIEGTAKWGSAAVSIPVSGTLKLAENQVIKKTIPRDGVFEIQTPQGFQADIIRTAQKYALKNSMEYTDDCMAVEAIGVFPVLLDGSRMNIKITYPEDLILADAIYNLNAR